MQVWSHLSFVKAQPLSQTSASVDQGQWGETGRNNFLRNVHVPQLQGTPELRQQAYPVRKSKGSPDSESQGLSPQVSKAEKPRGGLGTSRKGGE